MDFEWKQRIVFMFVVTTPLVLASFGQDVPKGGVINWSKNPNRVRLLQEFRQKVEDSSNEVGDDSVSLPACESSLRLSSKIRKSFDARRHWRECPSLWEIRDQGACSSWAVGVASVLTDRYCIASGGKDQWRISEQDLLNCAPSLDNSGDISCQSVAIRQVWDHVAKNGVVTGGYFLSGMGCQPTTMEPCYGMKSSSCDSIPPEDVATCRTSCTNPRYLRSYENDKKKIAGSCRITATNLEEETNDDAIKAEIYKNGPVLAVMRLYDDLHEYDGRNSVVNGSGGMYQSSHSISDPHVLHPVKIVGWDSVAVEGNGEVGYWIVANSWGYAWGGVGGFFRVRMSSEMPELGAWIATDVSWPVISTTSSPPGEQQGSEFSSFFMNHILRKFRISITFPPK